MSETPGRGYLPPTVPAPGPHRRQWPTFNYFPGQWQGKQPFIMAPSSPPQSESMDLSSRPDVNGAEVNGTGVSVIAPNPLVAEEKPGKLPIESARGFEGNLEPCIVSKTFPSLSTEDKVPDVPSEETTPPDIVAESRTSPVEEKSLPQPEVPVEAPAPPSESAAQPEEEQKDVEAADHVESLLENMFQGDTKPSVIVANCTRPPVLTEDKVVEILQDSSTSIKEEPKESQFMEVESELEKMFAGIEEEKPPIPPVSEPIVMQPEKKVKKQSKPRQRKSTDSVEGKKRKAKRRERQRPKKTKREKENSNDSTNLSRSVRGPYVHVEGSKEAPQYVSIVNSGGKEEEEKDRGDRRKHQTFVEGL